MASQHLTQRLTLRSISSPEVANKLQDATKKFKEALNEDDRKDLKKLERQISKSLGPTEILENFIQQVDKKYQSRHGSVKKYTNRLMGFLSSLQPLLAGVDIMVGGSQNIIACTIWGTFRMCLQLVCNKYELLEKLTDFLKEMGTVSADYREILELYPPDQELRQRVCGHLLVAVDVCTVAVGILNSWNRAAFTTFEAKFKPLEKRLDREENAIKRTILKLQAPRKASPTTTVSKLRKHPLAGSFLNACSHYKFRDGFRRAKTKGESLWAQNTPDFQDWKNFSESATMWVEGKIGAGKSVSTAGVVESLIQARPERVLPRTAYFFCEFDNKTSLQARTILGALARQLLNDRLKPDTDLDFEEGQETLDAAQIIDHLERILPCDPQGYFLIVDGFNECPKYESRQLVTWLKQLQEARQIFRIYLTVRAVTVQWAKNQLKPRWTIQLPNDRPEIKEYLEVEMGRLADDGTLQTRDPILIQYVKDQLLQKCDGMLLWLRFQLERIGAQSTDAELRQFVEQLPEDLEDTYDRIMMELPFRESPNHASRCQRIFALVACAKRPLTLDELGEALSVEPEDRDYKQEQVINDMQMVLEQVGSLVIFDEVGRSVHFAHHSVRDHIMGPTTKAGLKKYHICQEESDLWFGKICVAYLTFPRFGLQMDLLPEDGAQNKAMSSQSNASFAVLRVPEITLSARTLDASRDRQTRAVANMLHVYSKIRGKSTLRKPDLDADVDISHEEPTGSYPFFKYAKEYWLWHTINFQNLQNNRYSQRRWEALVNGEVASLEIPWAPKSFEDLSPELMKWAFTHGHDALIHAIARAILNSVYITLEEQSQRGKNFLKEFHLTHKHQQKTPIPPYYGLVLLIAIDHGDTDLAESLIFLKGVDLNVQSKRGNALRIASQAGATRLVRSLINAGVNLDSGGSDLGSPLAAAAFQQHLQIVSMLLDAGADATSLAKSGDAMIAAARTPQSIQIVQTLRAHRAPINIKSDADSETPLREAVKIGNSEVVLYLLRNGANPNLGSTKTGYPLEAATAALHPNVEIVLALIMHGANVNLVGGKFGTPLNASFASHNNWHIAELLLQHGANIHLQAGAHGNALQNASQNGRLNAVEKLLSLGAKCNAVGEGCSPAIAQAARSGWNEIIHVLLNNGADINKTADTTQAETALYLAAQGDQCDTMRLLIEQKALLEDETLRVLPLLGAARFGNIAAAKILIEAGANVNTQEKPGPWNADHMLFGDHDEIYMTTALHCAAAKGFPGFIQFLIDKGADPNLHTQNNPNALWIATCYDQVECVQLLLENDAAVTVTSSNGHVWDALAEAQRRHLVGIVQVIHSRLL